MRRLHAFEWGDQRWVPRTFRRYVNDLLAYQADAIYAGCRTRLLEWLRFCAANEITDLCSGSGGPWASLSAEFRSNGWHGRILLTDRNPPPTFANHNGMEYHGEPVDALGEAVPAGALTMFSAFHHFRPSEAERFLRHVATRQRTLAIFEFTQRRIVKLIGMLLSPLVVWVQTPRLQLSWGRLFWTYVLPIVPFMYAWDGLISHARSYTTTELRELCDRAGNFDYVFHVEEIRSEGAVITALFGHGLDVDGRENRAASH